MPDNNDGITVIDITDPTNPGYGFLLNPGAVKTAEQYIRNYYPTRSQIYAEITEGEISDDDDASNIDTEDDENTAVSQSIALLDGERLITLAMLAEAWPYEYQKTYDASLAKANTKCSSSESAATDDVSDSVAQLIPSLADLAVKPAVEYGLKTGDTEDIQELVWLPGKAALIKAALRSQNPLPDSALPLLVKVLQHELESSKTLDLSRFFMSSAQIGTVLGDLDLSSASKSVDTVKLSHSPPSVTIDAVRSILSSVPKVQRLDLLDTHISRADLLDLLTSYPTLFTHLSDLLHESFLTLRAPPVHTNGFSAFAYGQKDPNIVYLTIWTPAKVIKCLTDFLSLFVMPDRLMYSLSIFQSMAFQAAFSSGGTNTLRTEKGKEGKDLTWGERFVPGIPTESLAALRGDAGWFFAFNHSLFLREAPVYGFVKVDKEAMTSELKRIEDEEEEGRTAEEDAKAEGGSGESGSGATSSGTGRGNARTRAWPSMNQFTEPYPPGLWRVCDLRGWLEEMEKEGRPRPEDGAVKDLEDILEKLAKPQEGEGMVLLPYEQVPKFMGEVEYFDMISKSIRER